MKRALWLIFGALAALAAVILLPFGGAGDVVETASTADAETRPAPALAPVKVRHEFVTASAPTSGAAESRPAPVAAARAPQKKTPPLETGTARRGDAAATAVDLADRAETPRGFLAKAGRLVVGDGRYRPEPFPRIKK